MLSLRSSLLARVGAVALAVGVAAPALSQSNYGRPNFNYVGGGYGWQDLEFENGGSCEQDGLYIEGSLLMNEQLFVQANLADYSGDGCGSTTSALGIGIRADYGSSSSLYGVLQGLIRKFDDVNDSDPGVGLSGGIRTMVRTGLEGSGFAGFEAVDGDNQLYIGAGLNYWVSPEVSLKGNVTLDDEGSTGFSIGARYNF